MGWHRRVEDGFLKSVCGMMQCRTYMRARTHTHAHTYAHTCARTLHMHTCTCTCTFTRTCKTCTYTCMQRSAHVDQQSIRDLKRTQGDSSLSLYTFYVQTHTYIHTHNQRRDLGRGHNTVEELPWTERECRGFGCGREGETCGDLEEGHMHSETFRCA